MSANAITLDLGIRDLRQVSSSQQIKYGDEIEPGMQIRVEYEDGRTLFTLFRKWMKNSKPQKSKLILHEVGKPHEEVIKVNPRLTKCFIAS